MLTVAIFALLVQEKEEVWIGTVYPETHPVNIRDRAEFTKKFDEIEEGMTMDEVRTILGPPDDVFLPSYMDFEAPSGVTAWKYGSTSAASFSGYGEVPFFKGRVPFDYYISRPAVGKVTDERAFIDALHAIWEYVDSSLGRGNRPLQGIRAANLLIGLGRAEARLAMKEYVSLEPVFIMGAQFSVAIGHTDPGRLFLLAEMLHLVEPVQNEGWQLVSGLPLRTSEASGPRPNLGFEGVFIGWYDRFSEDRGFRKLPFAATGGLAPFVDFVLEEPLGSSKSVDRGIQVVNMLSLVDVPLGGEIDPTRREVQDQLDRYLVDVRMLSVKWSDELSAFVPVSRAPRQRRRSLIRTFEWSPGELTTAGVSLQLRFSYPGYYELRLLPARFTPEELKKLPLFEISVFVAEPEQRLKLYGTNHADGRLPAVFRRAEDPSLYGRSSSGGLPETEWIQMEWAWEWDGHDGGPSGEGNYIVSVEREKEVWTGYEILSGEFSGKSLQMVVKIGDMTYRSPLLRP